MIEDVKYDIAVPKAEFNRGSVSPKVAPVSNRPLEKELIKPFGPTIGRLRWGQDMIDAIRRDVESILIDSKKKNAGYRLAGQIAREYEINIEDPHYRPLVEIMGDMIGNYVQGMFEAIAPYHLSDDDGESFVDKLKKISDQKQIKCRILEFVQVVGAWIVDQKPGEYNPVHCHTDCTVSGIFYVDVEEPPKRDLGKDNNKPPMDGHIDFINHATRMYEDLEIGHITFKPRTGDAYIFPARLFHTVYPFMEGDESCRRLSISWNAIAR